MRPNSRWNERRAIKKPTTAATVARSEARYADQPFDLGLLHRSDEHSHRCGEKPRRFEDYFGPGRKPKRLDNDINSGQRAPHRCHLERVAGHFLKVAVVNRNSSCRPRQRTNRMPRPESGLHGLKPNSSAGADDQDCRHGLDALERTFPLTLIHMQSGQPPIAISRRHSHLGWRHWCRRSHALIREPRPDDVAALDGPKIAPRQARM